MAIQQICKHRGIHIHIVTGPGYDGYERLATEIVGESNVTLTHATGIMSDIMESCDVAITSNGRTVYELAHMNIPSLVIDQHERESSHNFGREDNGFISLGLYESGITESQVKEKLARLLDDGKYRYDLFSKMKSIEFTNSKKSIVDTVLNLNVNNDSSGE
jgi:spore coat polysaccharide biosynthesis predicted glycosyltransferase SpsG